MTGTALTDMHDADLAALDTPDARQVLTNRGKAAQQIRVTLARAYGRGDTATPDQWHVVPHLTDTGTIGVVDIARGTAWDTGVDADPCVSDLGLLPEDEAYAAANMPPGAQGTVRVDGEPAQVAGTAVRGGRVVQPSKPRGWRQVVLPTWRGYDPDARWYTEVPSSVYRPDTWIRPTLAAHALVTCYGQQGDPKVPLYLCATHGWESRYPWGVPRWVHGTSVTVLDVIADDRRTFSLCRTRLPRGDDATEVDRVRALWESLPPGSVPDPREYRDLREQVRVLLGEGLPWDAARVLARSGVFARDYGWEQWPGRVVGYESEYGDLLPGVVGIPEIAVWLRVKRSTVDVWRARGRLPEPLGVVGGGPVWDRSVVWDWARRTGRLPRIGLSN